MSAWLAVLLLAIVAAAVVGMIPLRRYADREWAEHVRRQRIAAMPEFQRISKAFVELQIAIVDSFTPAMQEVAAALARLAGAFPRAPWHVRALRRVTFGRWPR